MDAKISAQTLNSCYEPYGPKQVYMNVSFGSQALYQTRTVSLNLWDKIGYVQEDGRSYSIQVDKDGFEYRVWFLPT